ncbi:hypothetical protein BC567DRAFT_260963 [Phyllosticta citribraziliensis]
MAPRSGPAFPGCPLNEREVTVVVAALRHLSTKPTVNEPAMTQALGFTNVRSAKISFFRILKSLGNDPIQLPSFTDASSKQPATRHKRAKKQEGEELADTPPPDRADASDPVPSIEEAATTASKSPTKDASKGKKRAASAEPKGKLAMFKRHRRFERNDDE